MSYVVSTSKLALALPLPLPPPPAAARMPVCMRDAARMAVRRAPWVMWMRMMRTSGIFEAIRGTG
jgi:hypothetical protein